MGRHGEFSPADRGNIQGIRGAIGDGQYCSTVADGYAETETPYSAADLARLMCSRASECDISWKQHVHP